MKCPAYGIMNIVWHTVQFLQVRTEEVCQKILQELGQCGCLWSIVLGGSMKSCHSRSNAQTTHVSFSSANTLHFTLGHRHIFHIVQSTCSIQGVTGGTDQTSGEC